MLLKKQTNPQLVFLRLMSAKRPISVNMEYVWLTLWGVIKLKWFNLVMLADSCFG